MEITMKKQLLLGLALFAIGQAQAAQVGTASTATQAQMSQHVAQVVQAAKGHAKVFADNVTTAAGHIKDVAQTTSSQINHLASTPAGKAVTNQMKHIANKTQTLVTFAQSPAAQAALEAHAEVEKQANAQPTEAGRLSVKNSQAAQQHLAPHKATVAQAQEHLNDVKNAVNGLFSQEVLIALFSEYNSQSDALQNFIKMIAPFVAYMNSQEVQQMLDHIGSYLDTAK